IDTVHGYISWLGFYNNAVHFSLNYPWMRRELSIGMLARLAEAPSARTFLSQYADVANRMFQEAGYDLVRWTGPDPYAAPSLAQPAHAA
ncbi:MAG TPA: hypothetical protein VJ011_04650, partial [Steroidobacteraceae bacterium]|nr:hypothetical protein [Steroidobacteraceae bacterium]